MPDDQVCGTCQAVVLDMDAHQQYHVGLADFVRQRIEGVERHIRANAQQAMDLIGIEQRNRDTAVEDLQARIDRIEDELRTADYLRTQENLCDERDDPNDEHVIVNMAGEHVATLGEPERDGFLYDVASCGECWATRKKVTLCPHHRALVVLAREEVHAK